MAEHATVAQLDGLFKHVYAKNLQKLVPEAALLTKMIRFVEREREPGNKYNQPVNLSYEHGATYAGVNAGAFTLNSSIALTDKEAQVDGNQFVLRSCIPYDSAAKASNNKKAFLRATEHVVENMMESTTKRLELTLLYGQSTNGLGQPASSANVDATHTVITIATGQWATAIWAGMENAEIDVLDAGTVINTTGAVTIDSVDFDNRAITVSAAAGDITAIDGTTFDTSDAIVFRGANGNEMAGLDKIITNTGTLFGISATDFALWKGQTSSAASADLTFGKVNKGLAKAVALGLDSQVDLFVNPETWGNLNDDLAALRTFDTSFKPGMGTLGNEAITYHSQNGIIKIHSHRFVKEGEAYALPLSKALRIGATDTTFNNPGKGGEFFRELDDKAGFELRNYWNQALFIRCPARCVKFTNIVNS